MTLVGIRREDKHEWERRTPLAPQDVKALVAGGVDVVVQPSPIRVFPESEYVESGATVSEDLSDCRVVYGIKEFPSHVFRAGQAYAYFSHVIKGQPHNMPMLQALLDRGSTLIDYERVTDDSGLRLLYFGNYAGLAGMIETLHALGRRYEARGITTPFLAVKRPLDYGSLGEAVAALEVVGSWIRSEGLPDPIVPLVIGFAGYGNVSTGAQSILDHLPVHEIAAAGLDEFMLRGEHSAHKLYKVVFHESEMVVPVAEGKSFELEEYYRHPERYRGVFDRYLGHLSVLVNGIYWDERYPRLLTLDWLQRHWTPKSRLAVIGDISCDVGGAIECNVETTDPGRPVYAYDPSSGDIQYGYGGDGPLVMAIDTLPCELPRESSTFFSGLLRPYVSMMAAVDYDEELEDLALSDELKRAVVAHHGSLTPQYEYIAAHLVAPDQTKKE